MLSNHWSRAANMSSEFLLEPQSAEHWGIHYLLCLYHGMMPKGLKMVEEENVSRYFIASYRRLVQLGDEEGVRKIHEHLPLVKQHLPTAFRLIERVLEKIQQVSVA